MRTLFNKKSIVIGIAVAIFAVFYGISINANAATLNKSSNQNIKIKIQTVLYVGDMDIIDCSEKAKITSSDESVVYIDEDGFMVAAAPGEAVITVKDGKHSQKIEILVPNECIPGDHDYHTDKHGLTVCKKCGSVAIH